MERQGFQLEALDDEERVNRSADGGVSRNRGPGCSPSLQKAESQEYIKALAGIP